MRALSRKIAEKEHEIYIQRIILQDNYALLKEYVKTDKFILLTLAGSVVFGFLFVRKKPVLDLKRLMISPVLIKRFYQQAKNFILPLLV